MTEVETKKYFEWIDLAKGLAMILVIFAHSMEWFSSDLGVKTFLLPLIYSFHIPLFFYVSGFLFSKNISIGKFSKKLLKNFVLPYITFSVIIISLDAIKIYLLKSEDDIVIKDKIIDILTQEHYNVLWFVAALMLIEITAYFICKIDNNKLLIVVAMLFVVIAYGYYKFINKMLPWCIDEVIYAMPFFLLGYVTKKSDNQEKLLEIKYSPIYLILGVGANIINLMINKSVRYVNMFKCDFGNIFLFYISAIFMLLFVLSLCKKIGSINFLNYIGKNSLVYYALHLTAFQFVFHFLQPIFNNTVIEYFIFCIVSTVLVLIAMTIVNIIFTKTPLCIFIGKPRKKKQP